MTTIAPAMEITVPAGMAVIGPIPAAPTECAPVSTTITAREMATVPTKVIVPVIIPVIVPVTISAIVPVMAIVPPMWLPRRDLTVPPVFVVRFRDPSLRLPDGVRVPAYLLSMGFSA